jgi:hypothetical protein
MKKSPFLFSLLFISLVIGSCNPIENFVSSNHSGSISDNFGNTVSRDFIGQVVDVNNLPIQNATVSISTTSVQTDSNGVFIITHNVRERFAYLTVKKAGYADGSRSLVPTTGKNTVKIMLLPQVIQQTIHTGLSSEVALSSGTKVIFDGAFQDANGNLYSGDVSVSLYHLTPSNANVTTLMPGMLFGEDANGDEKLLESFGMARVALLGSGGQKVQIAAGHSAKLVLKIDDNQLASAATTIPLWYFDEAAGYWIEEGSATKIGNKYEGVVNHFSWWNCDQSMSAVTLKAKVVDGNGNPLSGVQIDLTSNESIYPRSGVTDSNGEISGLIPANETLTMKVYSSFECGSLPIITSVIGPFSENTILPDIVINNSSAISSTTVHGNLIKCDTTNVTNGYVMLYQGNQSYMTSVTNGAFSFNTTYCSSNTNFTLKAIDYDNTETTGSVLYNFSSPMTMIGNLPVCNGVTDFVSYQINGGAPRILLSTTVTTGITFTGFMINSSNPNEVMTIFGQTITPGTYNGWTIKLEGSNAQEAIFINSGTTNTMSFHLNNYGLIGEYIDMTFDGTYLDTTTGATKTLNGVVHTIRTN